MARGKNLINFDARRYAQSLRAECMKIMVIAKQMLYQQTVMNANSIDYSTNIIHMADESVTSDNARKRALIKSIVFDPSRMTWEDNYTRLRFTLTAMGSEFEDSHIGWFYEYGTGTNFRTPPPGIRLPDCGDPNPRRNYHSSEPIVTRYRGDNEGLWFDMGGNKRITRSGEGGRHTPTSYNTKEYRWMESALTATTPRVTEMLRDVHKRVNPSMFLTVNNLHLK